MPRVLLSGLGVMGAVALATALWPPVGTVVTILLVTVTVTVVAVPAASAVRWARRELADRRQLRTMVAAATAAAEPGAAPSTPMLVELRESA